LRDKFGTRPEDVTAAIGPGIGVCCYQVGEEVARRFGQDSAGRLDLAEVNLRQLTQAGVPRAHIDLIGGCTFCDAERFHSFRRDGGRAGRMISYIGVV
jgi:copper oxidase (laccase) domain-containing protein